MDAAAMRAGRDRLAAQHGPWVASNIHLGHGVYTMGNDHVGTTEFLIHAIVQAVADVASKPLAQLRILDLACREGGYAIEFGLHGATVVGVEGRPANLHKARFAAEALGLDRVRFEEGDVRNVSEEALGRFDVVLCLGIVYHLEAEDAVRLIERCNALCDEMTIVRSAVGLSPNATTSVGGREYRGRRYRENTRQQGASLDNTVSLLPSRPSLLNLLADVGFSSVLEVRNPTVPGLDDMRDSVTLVALRGERVSYKSISGVDAILPDLRRPERRAPSWIWSSAHPQQGIYWRWRERIFHTFRRTIFQSRQPIDTWRRPP
jgi:hypothetical protein